MIAADEDQPALEVFYTALKQCKIILVQHILKLSCYNMQVRCKLFLHIILYKQEYI